MKWTLKRFDIELIEPLVAERRKAAGTVVVVDVRETDEWKAGHIPGARHIPLGQVQSHVTELLAVPEIIFVCRSGTRSASATRTLAKAGHSHAVNLTGGMIAWRGAQLPVTS